MTASVVLDTYLRALQSGDCTAARAVATPTFKVGNGDLCGEVKVSAFSVDSQPSTPGLDDVVYSTALTTAGNADGTIAPGKTIWFYDLKRHSGQWKLVGVARPSSVRASPGRPAFG